MSVEVVPFVTEKDHQPVFESLKAAAEAFDHLLHEGVYLGHIALSAQADQAVDGEETETGYLVLLQKKHHVVTTATHSPGN